MSRKGLFFKLQKTAHKKFFSRMVTSPFSRWICNAKWKIDFGEDGLKISLWPLYGGRALAASIRAFSKKENSRYTIESWKTRAHAFSLRLGRRTSLFKRFYTRARAFKINITTAKSKPARTQYTKLTNCSSRSTFHSQRDEDKKEASSLFHSCFVRTLFANGD